MPRIEFTEDAEYEVANEDGTRKATRIAKGTIQDVNEATAARWERRGKVKRVLSRIEHVMNTPPAPPAAPVTPVAPPSPPAPPAPPAASMLAAPPSPPSPPAPAGETLKRGPGRPRTTSAGNE